jgi:hypothetical protein
MREEIYRLACEVSFGAACEFRFGRACDDRVGGSVFAEIRAVLAEKCRNACS